MTLFELVEAEKKLIKYIQYKYLNDVILRLKLKQQMLGEYKCLSPFLDENGMVRIEGRLHNLRELPREQQQPYLLPNPLYKKDGKKYKINFVLLMIESLHVENFHANLTFLIPTIRRKFWPLNITNSVKYVIRNCKLCFLNSDKEVTQLQGPLPLRRIPTMTSRAHQHVAVDMCGYFLLRSSFLRSNKTIKAYVIVFVCLISKHTSLQLVTSASAEHYLLAVRRYTNTYGLIQTLQHDRGGNFIKGAKKLQNEYYEMIENCQHEIRDELIKRQIQFILCCRATPHTNSVVERMIGSFKKILKNITMQTLHLDYEHFLTVISNCENILNSRPLAALSNDPSDFSYLTPNHLANLRPLTQLLEPQPSIVSTINQLQTLKKLNFVFWKKFSEEHLHLLQKRFKWANNKVIDLLKVNDLVIVRNNLRIKNYWKLARVIEVHLGTDNLVRFATVQFASKVQIKLHIKDLIKLPYVHSAFEEEDSQIREELENLKKRNEKNSEQKGNKHLLHSENFLAQSSQLEKPKIDEANHKKKREIFKKTQQNTQSNKKVTFYEDSSVRQNESNAMAPRRSARIKSKIVLATIIAFLCFVFVHAEPKHIKIEKVLGGGVILKNQDLLLIHSRDVYVSIRKPHSFENDIAGARFTVTRMRTACQQSEIIKMNLTKATCKELTDRLEEFSTTVINEIIRTKNEYLRISKQNLEEPFLMINQPRPRDFQNSYDDLFRDIKPEKIKYQEERHFLIQILKFYQNIDDVGLSERELRTIQKEIKADLFQDEMLIDNFKRFFQSSNSEFKTDDTMIIQSFKIPIVKRDVFKEFEIISVPDEFGTMIIFQQKLMAVNEKDSLFFYPNSETKQRINSTTKLLKQRVFHLIEKEECFRNIYLRKRAGKTCQTITINMTHANFWYEIEKNVLFFLLGPLTTHPRFECNNSIITMNEKRGFIQLNAICFIESPPIKFDLKLYPKEEGKSETFKFISLKLNMASELINLPPNAVELMEGSNVYDHFAPNRQKRHISGSFSSFIYDPMPTTMEDEKNVYVKPKFVETTTEADLNDITESNSENKTENYNDLMERLGDLNIIRSLFNHYSKPFRTISNIHHDIRNNFIQTVDESLSLKNISEKIKNNIETGITKPIKTHFNTIKNATTTWITNMEEGITNKIESVRRGFNLFIVFCQHLLLLLVTVIICYGFFKCCIVARRFR